MESRNERGVLKSQPGPEIVWPGTVDSLEAFEGVKQERVSGLSGDGHGQVSPPGPFSSPTKLTSTHSPTKPRNRLECESRSAGGAIPTLGPQRDGLVQQCSQCSGQGRSLWWGYSGC